MQTNLDKSLDKNKQFRFISICASILVFLAIAVGAFGAHAWSDVLTENNSHHAFSLANDYQWYNAIALFVLALMQQQKPQIAIFKVCLLILIGVTLFSGSLYLYALSNYSQFAMITPLGGVLLLCGWGMIVFKIWFRLASG